MPRAPGGPGPRTQRLGHLDAADTGYEQLVFHLGRPALDGRDRAVGRVVIKSPGAEHVHDRVALTEGRVVRARGVSGLAVESPPLDAKGREVDVGDACGRILLKEVAAVEGCARPRPGIAGGITPTDL